jgi:hypothetical protein
MAKTADHPIHKTARCREEIELNNYRTELWCSTGAEIWTLRASRGIASVSMGWGTERLRIDIPYMKNGKRLYSLDYEEGLIAQAWEQIRVGLMLRNEVWVELGPSGEVRGG